MSEATLQQWLGGRDRFVDRHIGPRQQDIVEMLRTLGYASLEELVDHAVPRKIRSTEPLQLPSARSEQEALQALEQLAERNQVARSYIGMGYHACITPPVIQRNILENPGWYTQYTPYQAEISQGRLEALLNFQTLVSDLTALPLANASLLDEGTAAAEAMSMCRAALRGKRSGFFASDDCHPQTLAVLRTRAEYAGLTLHVGRPESLDVEAQDLCGVLLQYPTTDGRIPDVRELVGRIKAKGALVVMAADPLALTLIEPPGELGADIAVGSMQRFGVPMGYGGPHAAYLSTHEKYKRQLPGRLVGVSKDADGVVAYRLAIQTREQHIRRDKATSNICTAQVLLAIVASMYAVYHGPEGLRAIARRVHGMTALLAEALRELGIWQAETPFFDTLCVELGEAKVQQTLARAEKLGINLRRYDTARLAVSLDETTSLRDVADLLEVFAGERKGVDLEALAEKARVRLPEGRQRSSDFLTHEVFDRYHSEHELLRYMQRLQERDVSLTTSMIPLGSCTMKLNATAEMVPLSWPQLAALHPFAPREQAEGYHVLFEQLQAWLADLTGFSAVSLQPNAGSQGEYAGLLAIRGYHESRGEGARDVCLIPTSAHGTNPASAVIAGFQVVPIDCDRDGNIDPADLQAKAEKHADRLGALMITYPSTHGVFEQTVREICEIVHRHGGQVYLDGANMNAMVGLVRPAEFGADVCHLNLHKTFCIPHGGGGPGAGPIAVAEHLKPFLPGHPMMANGGDTQVGAIASAPYGSPSILHISWMYIAMMGAEGLTRATQVAILNANYMAKRLEGHYDILYRGADGLVAHEFVLDARGFKQSAGVEVEDIAKRLIDFGFHAPTMSWPVPGTLMVEPTESESREELDRFCDALITIRKEIRAIEQGRSDREDNPLKRAPHSAQTICRDPWDRAYSRDQAAFPLEWLRALKKWPPVSRIDNVYGDRNLMCTCPPVQAYPAGSL